MKRCFLMTLAPLVFFLLCINSCKKQKAEEPIPQVQDMAVEQEMKKEAQGMAEEPVYDEWKPTLLYEAKDISSVATEPVPYAYEADLYEAMDMQVFTPEELGERFKFMQWKENLYSVIIYNQDMKTALFCAHREPNVASQYGTNSTSDYYAKLFFSGDGEDCRRLLVILDRATDEVTKLILINEVWGEPMYADGYIRFIADGAESYGWAQFEVYTDGIYKGECNAFTVKDANFRDFPGASKKRDYLESFCTLSVTKRTAEPITCNGETCYWYSADGTIWYPATEVYLMPGTFETLESVEVPVYESYGKGIWLMPNDEEKTPVTTFKNIDLKEKTFYQTNTPGLYAVAKFTKGGNAVYEVIFPQAGYVSEKEVHAVEEPACIPKMIPYSGGESASINVKGGIVSLYELPTEDSELVQEVGESRIIIDAKTDDGWYFTSTKNYCGWFKNSE